MTYPNYPKTRKPPVTRREYAPGDMFKNWEILEEAEAYVCATGKTRMFRCRCSCGEIKVMRLRVVLRGDGHCPKCRVGVLASAFKHGQLDSPEYRTWAGMLQRCTNPQHPAYKHYGKRGITVYPPWMNFNTFLHDVGKKPGPEYSLDRWPDTNGNYEPGNVRWATWKQQANNKTNNRYIEHEGVTHTISEWADLTGLPAFLISLRIVRHKWDVARALSEPRADSGCGANFRSTQHNVPVVFNGLTKTLDEWADTVGISRGTLYCRIYKYGWSVDRALTQPIVQNGWDKRKGMSIATQTHNAQRRKTG